MATVTCNVHVHPDTPIKATGFDGADAFTSLRIGDASILMRGDDILRVAAVLNEHIATNPASLMVAA